MTRPPTPGAAPLGPAAVAAFVAAYVVLNVLDASNLERNLYLTTQLIDMHLRMVCALNMFDETERRGDNIDHVRLGKLLAVPMVPTQARLRAPKRPPCRVASALAGPWLAGTGPT